MTTTNVDETGKFLWIYSNGPYGRSYSKIEIPALTFKNVNISAVNGVRERVRITISGVGQGATIKGHYIYHLHGFKNQGTLAIVDLNTGKEVQKIDLVALGFIIGDHGNFYRLYDATPTNIEVSTMPRHTSSHIDYDIAGQPVTKNYKGIVISNGKKLIRK